MRSVVIDGIECDWERVAEAPGRCIRAMERIREFEPIMGDIPEVVDLVRDLKDILSGAAHETAWQASATQTILDAAKTVEDVYAKTVEEEQDG